VTRRTNNPATANNPTPKGQCITQVNGAPYPNPFGQLGSRPAFSPPWQFELRARYDWAAGDFKPFAWVGASHIASMSNEPANFRSGNAPSESPPTGWPTSTLLRYQIPGYITYDGALGVAKDNWTAQIQGHNLSNAYGPTNVSAGLRARTSASTGLTISASRPSGKTALSRRCPPWWAARATVQLLV
jgi:iron complex outermembrane receptor protein